MMPAFRVDRARFAPLAVGASELGALIGCDPWTTPLALYRQKRGLDPDRPDNAAMQLGRELEGSLVDLGRRRIPLRVRRNRDTFMHHTLPLFATPDAFVGSDRLLEVKVVGTAAAWSDWRDDEDDAGIPCRVRLQAQGQMLVTGRDAVYVGALIGSEYRLVVLEADLAVQDTIGRAVTSFVLDHLDPGIPPDPMTWDEKWSDLLERLVEAPALEALAGERGQALGDRLLEARDEASRLGDEVDGIRLELLEALVDAGATRLVADGWSAAIQPTRTGRTLVVRAKGTR